MESSYTRDLELRDRQKATCEGKNLFIRCTASGFPSLIASSGRYVHLTANVDGCEDKMVLVVPIGPLAACAWGASRKISVGKQARTGDGIALHRLIKIHYL